MERPGEDALEARLAADELPCVKPRPVDLG
jgi:hypothetical protein